ncbi:hypothetical protein TIFTF001_037091 [Ficus carica]|uniref:Uncharacterized protein n=1 Tax=Ficus carica TaxID=3494 RepID=A0AA88E4X0_FICCA|nr:hypothetical protein TIFTF001_037091 [Ficus carica]
MRGRIDIIKLLFGARKESVLEVMPDGQTVLHLCVRYNHLEALKVLVESEIAYENCWFLNSKEPADGNTILHLAVMLKQIEPQNQPHGRPPHEDSRANILFLGVNNCCGSPGLPRRFPETIVEAEASTTIFGNRVPPRVFS